MARVDALLRISKTLLDRRNELRNRLHNDIDELAHNSSAGHGDLADAAFDTSGEEVAAHLAEIESKELALIDLAISRIKQGKYGICNGCDAKIPVARLEALPYSVLCITCQRESEVDTAWLEERMLSNFANLRDPDIDREITLAEIEANLS